jgi:GNAT superfamily N-acetyltransferase
LAPLVTDGVLADPHHDHLVGRIDGQPVACARIRRVLGTAYLSAITVLPQFRGQGYGLAISAAATRQARTTHPSLVWLAAVSELHPMYARLGYRPVDTHVLLKREP